MAPQPSAAGIAARRTRSPPAWGRPRCHRNERAGANEIEGREQTKRQRAQPPGQCVVLADGAREDHPYDLAPYVIGDESYACSRPLRVPAAHACAVGWRHAGSADDSPTAESSAVGVIGRVRRRDGYGRTPPPFPPLCGGANRTVNAQFSASSGSRQAQGETLRSIPGCEDVLQCPTYPRHGLRVPFRRTCSRRRAGFGRRSRRHRVTGRSAPTRGVARGRLRQQVRATRRWCPGDGDSHRRTGTTLPGSSTRLVEPEAAMVERRAWLARAPERHSRANQPISWTHLSSRPMDDGSTASTGKPIRRHRSSTSCSAGKPHRPAGCRHS